MIKGFTDVSPQSPLKKLKGDKDEEELEEEPPEQEELDWWSKYYASVEEMERIVRLFRA